MIKRVLGAIIDAQFPCAAGRAPVVRDLSCLLPLSLRLVNICEVGIGLKRESEGGIFLSEIRYVDILVDPVSDVPRNTEFKCLLGYGFHLPASRIALFVRAGRQGDVVTKPRVLLNV